MTYHAGLHPFIRCMRRAVQHSDLPCMVGCTNMHTMLHDAICNASACRAACIIHVRHAMTFIIQQMPRIVHRTAYMRICAPYVISHTACFIAHTSLRIQTFVAGSLHNSASSNCFKCWTLDSRIQCLESIDSESRVLLLKDKIKTDSSRTSGSH